MKFDMTGCNTASTSPIKTTSPVNNPASIYSASASISSAVLSPLTLSPTQSKSSSTLSSLSAGDIAGIVTAVLAFAAIIVPILIKHNKKTFKGVEVTKAHSMTWKENHQFQQRGIRARYNITRLKLASES